VTQTVHATLQALDRVGGSDLRLLVNPEIYPPEFQSGLDGRSGVVDGIITVPTSNNAWATLRDYSRTLIEARLRTL